MIHGDDWQDGPMSQIRDNCIEVLNSYGGKQLKYHTPDVSVTQLRRDLYSNRARPQSVRKC